MKIACTFPLGAPEDTAISGDRQMARQIVRGLQKLGHCVVPMTPFCSWQRHAGRRRAKLLQSQGVQIAQSDIRAWVNCHSPLPQAVVCYHLYHRAPDYQGAYIARYFKIPYVIIEGSYAPKRALGPWSYGFYQSRGMLRQADAVAAMTQADLQCLKRVVAPHRLLNFRPFWDGKVSSSVKRESDEAATNCCRLLCVAMMRYGDKYKSYVALAQALSLLKNRRWQLTIVGDGPARRDIEQLFVHFSPQTVNFVGRISPSKMSRYYQRADIFIWPAIREAFGMVFLEAQFHGLPVVAGHSLGVGDVVYDQQSGLLLPEGDVKKLAENLAKLMDQPPLRFTMGQTAQRLMNERHSAQVGKQLIATTLETACQNFAAKVR
ncbi:glycosyltransferase family 4 protein [Polycladidibacter stylochi]|uniref:glycosyltransferase family 4 protein n=1 Tax=Polycladidibacter stylochi TaxID=1807766 RepID=UPI00082C3F2A|nr:glycosyltransferase family 4 protein [Pseudovibrio stylochi]